LFILSVEVLEVQSGKSFKKRL